MKRTIVGTKFKLGTIVATRGVMEHVKDDAGILFPYIARHATGDWGEICDEDKEVNAGALEHGMRLMSIYRLPDGEKIWIITEWDRSVTTVLFPHEY